MSTVSRGNKGEEKVVAILKKIKVQNHVFNNVSFITEKNEMSHQIDHILVHPHGVFVIETKNYKGLIYGGDNAETWTKNMWGNKYSFRNPLKQNYGHVKSLQAIIDVSQNVFVPIVVFSNRANISVNTNEWVINLCHLRKVIKKYHVVKYCNIEAVIQYGSPLIMADKIHFQFDNEIDGSGIKRKQINKENMGYIDVIRRRI